MTVSINLPDYLRALCGERQPTCLVHAPPLSGLSQFARRLAQKPGFAYLDVLGTLAAQPDLSARLDQFRPDDLGRLIIQNTPAEADVLLVDALDFLFPIWGRESQPFQEMVRTLKHPQRPVACAFFVHTRLEWAQWPLVTAARVSRILCFDDLQPIV